MILVRSSVSLLAKPSISLPLVAALLVGGLLFKEASRRKIRLEKVLTRDRASYLLAVGIAVVGFALFPRGVKAMPTNSPQSQPEVWIEMATLKGRLTGVEGQTQEIRQEIQHWIQSDLLLGNEQSGETLAQVEKRNRQLGETLVLVEERNRQMGDVLISHQQLPGQYRQLREIFARVEERNRQMVDGMLQYTQQVEKENGQLKEIRAEELLKMRKLERDQRYQMAMTAFLRDRMYRIEEKMQRFEEGVQTPTPTSLPLPPYDAYFHLPP